MRILGKDGDGYELTVRLENAGTLREWLGAASHAKLMPYLASHATWHSFMNSTSSALLNLQMRVRALLFDKAAGCVYEDLGETIAPSSLNPSYLQLNGNAVYFPLDQDAEDFKRYQVNASRTSTTPLRHQPYLSKVGQVSQGQHAHNGYRRNVEDGHEMKGGVSLSQQKQASQGGHGFNNMINPKQEMSKPSLNKVKKVEAWDSSDATKRPMEMIGGTINKKLRSPKISNKAIFQSDGTGIPVRDHQDKMGSHKTAGGFTRNSEETSKVSSSASMGRAGHSSDTGDIGPLWYDQCAKTHLHERMQRLAQRAAQQKLPFPEREGFSRTSEGMVAYIEFNAKRQKTMTVVKQNPVPPGALSHGLRPKSSNEIDRVKGDPTFLPDLKFLANSVPDNPVPAKRRRLEKYEHQQKGLLDNLDELQLPSLKANKGVGLQELPLASESQLLCGEYSLAPKKDLSLFADSSQSNRPANKSREHGTDHMLRQTVGKLVAEAGFEGLKQSSLDLFVDILDSRFKKLSTGLRGLIDSYRRHCSQAEYLKMFIQISGNSMEDMMDQVNEGVQKQQLQEQQRIEQEQLQLERQEREQEELLLQEEQQRQEEKLQQRKQPEEEELLQQKQQPEKEEVQQEEQREEQREQETQGQQKLQQEDQLLKPRQGEETQIHQQQQQNPQKQRSVDQQQSPRRPDLQHSQQQQQPQQKVRQSEKQPLQSAQPLQQLQKQRPSDQYQQQQLQKQRQPDHQHLQQQQHQKQRQPENQYAQPPAAAQFPGQKKRPQPTQSPSRQSLPGKPAGMRSPSAPSAIDSVLKQARKACSETMEQHKQKADQVIGLIKQNPQKMSQMSMLAHNQRPASVGSPTKGLLTKSPDAYSGLLHKRQPGPQQSSGDKLQKRKQQQQPNMGRHSPNMGRNPKKVEKERPLDGKPLGDSRPVVGKKAMQMMSGGNSSSWHPSIPMVKSQTSPMLQHVKQQASSLQP